MKVTGINLDEKKVRRAGPNENVRVKVSGIEEEDIMAGFVLSSVGKCILQEKLGWVSIVTYGVVPYQLLGYDQNIGLCLDECQLFGMPILLSHV